MDCSPSPLLIGLVIGGGIIILLLMIWWEYIVSLGHRRRVEALEDDREDLEYELARVRGRHDHYKQALLRIRSSDRADALLTAKDLRGMAQQSLDNLPTPPPL